MRLNITIKAPTEPEDRTVGFTAEGLASIAGGDVVSTVQGYDSDGNDLAVIEWPTDDPADRDYITGALDADDRVISYR